MAHTPNGRIGALRHSHQFANFIKSNYIVINNQSIVINETTHIYFELSNLSSLIF